MDTTNWANETWTASNTIGTIHFRWLDEDDGGPDGGVRVPARPRPKPVAPSAAALPIPEDLACV